MAIKDVKIMCLYDALINPIELKDNPKNRNKHGQDQIEKLAQIYRYQGVRHPIIVSKLTGFIVAGHGRKLAAIRAGVDQMPVVYQDFENYDQEYAFVQSDNAVALWADLDIDSINNDLQFLSIDFDKGMLALQELQDDLLLEKKEKDLDLEDLLKNEFRVMLVCDSEQIQRFIFEELQNRDGIQCKIL